MLERDVGAKYIIRIVQEATVHYIVLRSKFSTFFIAHGIELHRLHLECSTFTILMKELASSSLFMLLVCPGTHTRADNWCTHTSDHRSYCRPYLGSNSCSYFGADSNAFGRCFSSNGES